MFCGQPSVQYEQPVHGISMLALMMSVAFLMSAFSSSFSGLKSCMYDVLSKSWSISLMPESTIFTFGRLAAKRIAQDGTEASEL